MKIIMDEAVNEKDFLQGLSDSINQTKVIEKSILNRLVEISYLYSQQPTATGNEYLKQIPAHRDFSFEYNPEDESRKIIHNEASSELRNSVSICFDQEGAKVNWLDCTINNANNKAGYIAKESVVNYSDLLTDCISRIVDFAAKISTATNFEENQNYYIKLLSDINITLLGIDIMAENKSKQTFEFFNSIISELSVLKIKYPSHTNGTIINDVSFDSLKNFYNEKLVSIYKNSLILTDDYIEVYSVFELLETVIEQILKYNKGIKVCVNCKRFFIPEKSGHEKYCRLTPMIRDHNEKNQICADQVAAINNRKRRSNTLMGKRDIIYNRLKSREDRSGNSDELTQFFKRDEVMRKKWKNHEISDDEYSQFLDTEDINAGNNKPRKECDNGKCKD